MVFAKHHRLGASHSRRLSQLRGQKSEPEVSAELFVSRSQMGIRP
jgi:hypothetical protein